MSSCCRRSSESDEYRSSMERCERRNSRRRSNEDEDVRRSNNNCDTNIRNHNHAFSAVTGFEEDDEGVNHNHIINGVTGRAKRYGRTHIHKVEEFVASERDHFHAICDTTGPAIYFSDGKHIHLVKGRITEEDGHRHDYYFVTQVENPGDVPNNCCC